MNLPPLRMDSRPARRRAMTFAGAAMMSVVIMASSVAQGQPETAGRDQEPEARVVHYYGIMGPVGKAGVYATDQPRMRLSELVHAAGGLGPNAPGTAQVIREGRRGQSLVYRPTSSDILMAGDLVVFSGPSAARGPISVAFVGLLPDRPFVVDPLLVTTLREIVEGLRQSPAVIQHVRVLHTSPAAPQLAPEELPSLMADGDVVVFDPATIDVDQLRQAVEYLPVRPVAVNSVSLMGSTPAGPSQQFAAEFSHPTAHRLRAIEASALPLWEHPELPMSSIEAAAANGSVSVALSRSTDSDVVPTGFMEERRTGDFSAMLPAPRPITVDGVKVAFSEADFAASSFQRLAMARHVGTSSTAEGAVPRIDERQAAIPLPLDLPQDAAGSPSRATTLGVTVLLFALMCFAVSVVWSRLDDETGLAREEHRAAEAHPGPQPSRDERTLERLIANSLPLIEEPSSLPEQVYHGEAVGRARIRIDAGHDVKRPHFSTTAPPTPPVKEPGTHSVGTAIHDRAANGADTPLSPLEQPNGLLERVLVAMEREKRR